jgi:hypothetical protein
VPGWKPPGRGTGRGPEAPDDRQQGSGRKKAIGERHAAIRGGAQLRRFGPFVISMGTGLLADAMTRLPWRLTTSQNFCEFVSQRRCQVSGGVRGHRAGRSFLCRTPMHSYGIRSSRRERTVASSCAARLAHGGSKRAFVLRSR